MKRTFKILPLLLVLLLALTACTGDLWSDALYTENTALGTGSTSFIFIVEAEGRSVEFSISTDKENLSEVLHDVGIVDGEYGQFGLYIKSVNGIVADYDANGAWWGLYIGDKAADTGASGVTVENGATYKMVYNK